MSDHPEVPRVTFNDDGLSMNAEQAIERFRALLETHGLVYGNETIQIVVEIRPCDCDDHITGRDDYCPLHGDKA